MRLRVGVTEQTRVPPGNKGQSTLYKFISLPTGVNPPEPLKGGADVQTQFRSNKRDAMAFHDAMKVAFKANRKVVAVDRLKSPYAAIPQPA